MPTPRRPASRFPCFPHAAAVAALLLVGCQSTPSAPSTPRAPHALRHARAMHQATDRPKPDPNDKVREQFQQRISVAFDKTPLRQALREIADKAGVNMYTSWKILAEEGVTKKSPVTLKLKDLPAAMVLDRVLYEGGANSPWYPLGYTVEGEVVTVSTAQELKKHTTRRVYDIEDLIVPVPVNLAMLYGPKPPNPLRKRAIEAVLLEKRNENNGSFDAPAHPSRFTAPTREERIRILTTLITDTVGSPDEWIAQSSSLREVNGSFIVNTTPANHRELQALFAKMRAGRVDRMARGLRAIEVVKLLAEAEKYRLKQDYPAALKPAEQAKRVSPDNPLVRAELRVLRQTMGRR